MTEPTANDPTLPTEPVPPVSRAVLRKVNRVATGPLFGGIPAAPVRKVSTAELSARVSPLGSLLGVRARLGLGIEGDQKP